MLEFDRSCWLSVGQSVCFAVTASTPLVSEGDGSANLPSCHMHPSLLVKVCVLF